MPPIAEANYFPPLDRCLAGHDRLISWKTAYRALSDSSTAQEKTVLREFLTSNEAVAILSNPLAPWGSPYQASRSAFDTKTAPIHVSHSSNGDYNLQEIKSDALWLSDEFKIEELVALRAAIVESQQRPAEDLLMSAAASEEAVAKTTESQGSLLASTKGFSASANGAVQPLINVRDEERRRHGLLRIYHEERNSLLKMSADLASRHAMNVAAGTRPSRNWIDELANTIHDQQYLRVTNQGDTSKSDACERLCQESITWIGRTLAKLDKFGDGPDATKADSFEGRILKSTTLINITAALRLVLCNVQGMQTILGKETVLAWFRLMGGRDEQDRKHRGGRRFLQDLQGTIGMSIPFPLQSLVSAVSLMMLQLPKVADLMRGMGADMAKQGGVRYPTLISGAYVQDNDCIKELNVIFYHASQRQCLAAGPAIFAWSKITMDIRELANFEMQIRELQALDEGSNDNDNRRRSSLRASSGTRESKMEKQYDALQSFELDEDRHDPPVFFARAALDALSVYSVIPELSTTLISAYGTTSGTTFLVNDTLLTLLRDTSDIVGYGAEIIEALLIILTADATSGKGTPQSHLATQIYDSEIFQASILNQAIIRYPYEMSPLLRLCTALATVSSKNTTGVSAIAETLEAAFRSFTVMVLPGFRSYALENEDENSNAILLTEDLPIFVSKRGFLRGGNRMSGPQSATRRIANGEHQDSNSVMLICAGTRGVVMKEDRPMIIKFIHAHSALEYLGLLLSTLLPGSDFLPAPPLAELDRYGAVDILKLINALLSAALSQGEGLDEARHLLMRAANALGEEQDIITVVADILEMELLANMDQAAQDGSLQLLVACVEFLALLTQVGAERVWSILARSSLLGINGGPSALAAVVGGSEVQTGDFQVLTSCCCSLYTALLNDAVTGLVKRKPKAPGLKGNTSRFEAPQVHQDSTSERIMSSVLTAFQRVVLDVFQNLGNWRFTNAIDKKKIAAAITSGFGNLLRATYGLDSQLQGTRAADVNDPRYERNGSLTAVLMPAVDMTLQAFAPTSETSLLLPTVASLLYEGLAVTDDVPQTQRISTLKQTLLLFEFTTRLLQTLRSLDTRRAETLSTALLKNMPVFAMLLGTEDAYTEPLSSLLSEVVQSMASQDQDPPALLAGLNTQAAKSFLTVVSQLDRPLCDVEVECKIWGFLAAVLQGRQQWFAMYLLTGTLPKTRLKETTASRKSTSLLTYALDELSNLATMNPERAKAMLRFVAVAQSVWVWATNEVRLHANFITNSLTWLDGLQSPPSRSADTTQALLSANEHRMAAYLCDILAVNVTASLEVNDKALLKTIVPRLTFLKEHAVIVNTYNRSLHRNLADNLARKFPGCELAAFKRSTANPAPYGREYVYDLKIADSTMRHEPAWEGSVERNGQGYSAEVARANINLSLVDAQVNLLRSWKTLATTLSQCVNQDTALQPVLATTVERCLRASNEARTDEPGTAEVLQVRAELAFVLLSKLVEAKVQDESMRDLLPVTWDLVRSSPVNYDVATAPEDLAYYRTLLQVLYLAIQPHTYMDLPPARQVNGTRPNDPSTEHRRLPPATAASLVEIVSKTIAPAFRALCSNLHSDLRLALPADFALVTALLQAVLAVKGIDIANAPMADAVANANLVRGTLSLYSWADQLAEVMDQDPIYGEIAVTFLLGLSRIPQVAEHMAVSGLLVQLSSANLSNYFRKPGGKGPFDEPRRMFTIWTEGFLSLCLNLLGTVGPALAAEVATFLNSFPEQLARAEDAFKTEMASHRRKPHRGDITLSLLTEAHSLIMIGLILQSDMAKGAAQGINAADIPPLAYDLANAKAEIEKLPRTKSSLADKIVACNEREADLAARPATAAYDNRLTELVMREVDGCLKCFDQ